MLSGTEECFLPLGFLFLFLLGPDPLLFLLFLFFELIAATSVGWFCTVKAGRVSSRETAATLT